MRIIIVGPGRAGLSLAFAADAAGHDVVALVARNRGDAVEHAASLRAIAAAPGDDLPAADLLFIATRDDAISTVATAVASGDPEVRGVAHLSGLTPVSALSVFASRGVAVGSFHPLQTLPTPETGANRIAGAWVAITATGTLHSDLGAVARSLGAHPFDLSDDAKPLYHAAASAAANIPLAALAMASDLFAHAGVPFEAARPMVEAVVANAFDMGPRPALTGPVARGDVATVDTQLDAIAAVAPSWLPAFTSGVRQLAAIAGRTQDFDAMLSQWQPDDGAVST